MAHEVAWLVRLLQKQGFAQWAQYLSIVHKAFKGWPEAVERLRRGMYTGVAGTLI